MRNVITYWRAAFFGVIIMIMTKVGFAQDNRNDDKIAIVEQLVNSKNFVFVAQSANPLGGGNIMLNSLYDVKVSGDTLHSQLPYFGRAFMAPLYSTQSPLQFSTTSFDYKLKEKKKGGYEIIMIPKDNRDIRQLHLQVTETGYARLQVFSNNRQPISFNGYIEDGA